MPAVLKLEDFNMDSSETKRQAGYTLVYFLLFLFGLAIVAYVMWMFFKVLLFLD